MGKSEVAKIFRDNRIPVFDADREVHLLYDSEAGANLLRPFVPEAIVDSRVSRAKLTEMVLGNRALLEKLETIVHTEVARRRRSFLAEAKSQGADLAVVDVPLLFEKAGDKEVDITIVVSAPLAEQRNRALARPGMTEQKLEMILKRQMPDVEKRNRAHFIIENDGSLEDLRARTEAVITEIRKRKA
jgi:dephospho-CoA kinase